MSQNTSDSSESNKIEAEPLPSPLKKNQSHPFTLIKFNNRVMNSGFGLAVILLFGVIIGFYVGIRQLKQEQKWVEHTYEVLKQIDKTLQGISNTERGQKAYIITEDSNYLSIYQTGIQQVKEGMQAVEQLTADNPQQQAHINILKNLVNQRLLISQQALKLWEQNPLARGSQITLTKQGTTIQKQIEAKLKEMEEIEQSFLLQQQQATTQSIYHISIWIGIGFFLSISFLLIIYLQLKQQIAARYQAEEELQQINEQLETRIQERTAQLTQLNSILEQEIEDRKQLEELLRESEARFRQAIYEAPLPIIIHAEDGEILQINWAWLEISGYSAEEISTISAWTKKVYGDNHETLRAYIGQLFELNQRVAEGEYSLVNREGKTLIWDYYSAPLKTLPDGRRVRITMAFNVTDRKEAEIALQASERRYATLTELSPVGIFHTDRDGNCIYVNQRWCEIAGLTPSQGRGTGWLKALHPEDQQRVRAGWIRAMATHTPFYLQYRFQNPDGKITWVMGQAIAEKTSSGEVVGYIGTITDISEQKETEIALSQSEERFRQAILNAPVPIAIYAEDGTVLQISRAWTDLSGYTLKDIPTLEDWLEKAYGSKKEQVRVDVQRLYNISEPLAEGEYIISTKNRVTRIWEFYSANLGTLSDGRRTVISTALDVTERKKTELQLKLTKQNLEIRVAERTAELQQELEEKQQTQKILLEQAQLLDLAHDTILTRDLKGKIIFWNKGAEKMYGFSQEEAVGENKHFLLKTQFPEPVTRILAQLFDQDYWEGELTHQKKDGSKIIVASRWVLQRDKEGKPSKILEINNDITARKRAEEALQQNEAMFRSLSESSPIGIFLTDANGQVLYSNPRYQEISGGNAEEVLGDGWKQFLHPEDFQTIIGDWTANLDQQQNSFYPEIRYCHKNGHIRYAQVYTVGIFTEQGKLTGFVGTVEDISDRRLIEQMKKDFISVVSHELRTPLTSIYGSLGLLAAGVYDNKPEKGKKMLQIAATQTERLVKLVSDILDLGRLESGKLQLEMQPCAATQLMQQSVEVMRPQATKQEVTLSVIPLDIEVWADFDAIIQTLNNLLSNAIKFSPPNSIILIDAELISSDDKIKLWQQKRPSVALVPSPYVLFKVKDQGRGIPPNKLELIFEKFQQVDATDSRDKGGTGLGLSICRMILEQHHGQIWAESELGEGSTFYFTLPLPPDGHNVGSPLFSMLDFI